jgi:glutaconate CoA-transferase subunit A
MTSTAWISIDQIGDWVDDGATVGVGGALFSRLPLALIEALAAAGRRELHYVSWGGGLPLEILLRDEGIVDRLTFCFSSLDVFGVPPRFRQLLENDKLAEVQEMSALMLIQALDAAAQRLPSLPLQRPVGSDLPRRTTHYGESTDPRAGVPVGYVDALPLDVALVHAQQADKYGNVEIAGSRGLDISLVYSARRVVVSVERVVPTNELGRLPHSVVVPRQFVDAVAVVPQGAYPSSCLPFYVADFPRIRELSADPWPKLSPPAPDRARLLAKAAADVIEHGYTPAPEPVGDLDAPPSVDEIMVCWLARKYDNDTVCSAGAVSPLAMASYLLAKATHAPGLTMLTTSGGYIDVGDRPLLPALGEALDFRSAAAHCGGEDSYHVYYQQGRVDYEVVAVAQVDARGRTNTVEVTSPSGRRVRLPGQGGMADVANLHQNFVLYTTRHSPLTLVDEVQVSSAARGVLTDADRTAAGLRPGEVEVLTDLAVFRLDHDEGRLRLVSVHPGVTVEQVCEQTGFSVEADEVPETIVPTVKELQVLRTQVDPLGVRRLEFVSGSERGALLDDLLAREDALLGGAS